MLWGELNLIKKIDSFAKMIFDYTLTAVGTLAISPLLFYIAYRIKKDSPGEVIYDGERIGKNGVLFKCYKFRSMYTNGDEILKRYLEENPDKKIEWDTYHKLDNDPRVTPIGNFIRKTSIDELPQLFNVLKGEMSLIGPRPYLLCEQKEMGEYYKDIIKVKPGISGYWQVNGRSSVSFENRLLMDKWYVFNRNLVMDVKLLWKTIGVVLNQKGAK